jgi:hypothetical protein
MPWVSPAQQVNFSGRQRRPMSPISALYLQAASVVQRASHFTAYRRRFRSVADKRLQVDGSVTRY